MRLQIVKPGLYGTRRLQAGDDYATSGPMGRALIALGKAKRSNDAVVSAKPVVSRKKPMVKKKTAEHLEEPVEPGEPVSEESPPSNDEPQAMPVTGEPQIEAPVPEAPASEPTPPPAAATAGAGSASGGVSAATTTTTPVAAPAKPWAKGSGKKSK